MTGNKSVLFAIGCFLVNHKKYSLDVQTCKLQCADYNNTMFAITIKSIIYFIKFYYQNY